MRTRWAGVAVLLLTFTTTLVAKGATTRITFATGGVVMDVTDMTVAQFNVWSGVGVTAGGVPQTEGFIADWSRVVAPPTATLRRYEVTFHAARDDQPERPVYVVTYVFDPAWSQGYVYLPHRADPHGELNTRSIRRGVEGQWFAATAAWDTFARARLAAHGS